MFSINIIVFICVPKSVLVTFVHFIPIYNFVRNHLYLYNCGFVQLTLPARYWTENLGAGNCHLIQLCMKPAI